MFFRHPDTDFIRMAFLFFIPMSTSKTTNRTKSSTNIIRFLIFSLTLGLAPFYPEPHILGKIRWVAGGAVGMQPMDWFDLVLHGAPWVGLIYVLLAEAKRKYL